MQGLHGQGELPSEALPPDDDAHLGGEVIPSPRTEPNRGRQILAGTPNTPGSLGIAISEAVEDAATHADTNYSLGSVLNHVMLHQTVIGLEAKKQMELAGEYPDVVIGCVGGGSNFAGLALPLPAGTSFEGKEIALHRRASRTAAPPDQAAISPTTSATPPSSPR